MYSCHRLYLKLCVLFKIIHSLCFSNIVISANSPYSHNTRHLTLARPFARTSSFFSSFLLDTIRHWNNLPESVVSSTTYTILKKRLSILINCWQIYFLFTGYIFYISLYVLFAVSHTQCINYYRKKLTQRLCMMFLPLTACQHGSDDAL